MELENLSIVNMSLCQANATATAIPAGSSPWLVKSAFNNVTFSTRNGNTLIKCFTTFRTMQVDVRFKNNLILQQAVPLGFSLKPRQNRVVVMDLRGAGLALKKDLVPVMEAELRSGSVALEFFFNTRYLRADRRSKWSRFGCVVVGTLLLGDVGSSVSKDCYSL